MKQYRILTIHNYYQEPGGEDTVFESEAALLESYGHVVHRLVFHNDEISNRRSLLASARLAAATVWSQRGAERVRTAVHTFRPDVVHFHNTFPLVSPAAYYAVKAEGLPVVQTLHNYRLICPNSLFLRDERVCEDCLGKLLPWPGVIHACYRGSRAASAATAAMLAIHRAMRSYAKSVDAYIALTEFERQKFIEGGLPAEKIVIKPNFLHPDSGFGEHGGAYALFVGRLIEYKGVLTLLQAWERLGGRIPLKVVGDGPLAEHVHQAAQKDMNVEWLGRQAKDQVLALMKDATVLLLPSLCYEGFPMVIVEAFSTGTPVIANNFSSLSSLIQHGRTGLHCIPGDADDLASKLEWAWDHPEEMAVMRQQVRAEFEAKYTGEQTYRRLMEIYALAIARSAGREASLQQLPMH